MAINYSKTTWTDGVTDVSAASMNNIENGVKSACDGVDELNNNLVTNIFSPKYITNDTAFDTLINNGTPGAYFGHGSILQTVTNSYWNIILIFFVEDYMAEIVIGCGNGVHKTRAKTKNGSWSDFK